MATEVLRTIPIMQEDDILAVIELMKNPTTPLSEDVLRCIRGIRDKCQKAEKEEQMHGETNQYSWRRGGSSHTTSSSIPVNSLHVSSSKQKESSYPSVNQWRGQQPTKAPSRHHSSHEKPAGRYVSKFTNITSPIEDKILNQVILNKLNKFSQANYEEVKQFLQQILDSNECNFLRDFMMLVFKKAASEPTFCPLYAKMVHELSKDYKSLLVELEKLYIEYLSIFEEVNEEECKDYEQLVQRNREKIHRLGYSQFLGELMGMGVLNQTQILRLYTTIFNQIKIQGVIPEGKQQLLEEYVDCLLRMSKALQKDKSMNLITVRKGLGKVCKPIMEDILAKRTEYYPGLSKKASFGLMDCLDIFKGV